MDGDESELEAAGEEAEHQQHIAAMAEGLDQRLLGRLRRRAGDGAAAVAGVASAIDSGNDQQHHAGEDQAARSASRSFDQRMASGENRNWPNEPAAVPAPKANRAPAFRNELAERADHHRNEQPARPKPISTPAERSSQPASSHRPSGETERIEQGAGAKHASGRNGRQWRRRTAAPRPTAGSAARARTRTRRGPSRCLNDSGVRNWPSAERGPKADQRDRAAEQR